MAHHTDLAVEEFEEIRRMVNAYLAKEGITDSQLAREAGVDQPMIFTVRHGGRPLKKRTARLTRLELYICMKMDEPHRLKNEVDQAIKKFIAAGGDVAFLPRGIAMLAGAGPGR